MTLENLIKQIESATEGWFPDEMSVKDNFNQIVLEHAKNLAKKIPEKYILLQSDDPDEYLVCLDNSGALCFDFFGDNGEIDFDVDENNLCSWACLVYTSFEEDRKKRTYITEHGQIKNIQEFPEKFIEVLDKIYPSL